MAIYEKIVDPGGTGDYSSLAAWEAGEQGLYNSGDTARAVCKRTTSALDTTALVVAGWTAGVIPSITAHPDYRHEGKWANQRADGHYVAALSVTGASAITAQVHDTVIDWLRVGNNVANNYTYIIKYSNVGGQVGHCLLKSEGGVGIHRDAIRCLLIPAGKTFVAADNIVCGTPGLGVNVAVTDAGSGAALNNTVYGATEGGVYGTTGKFVAINNVVLNNGSSPCFSGVPYAAGTDCNVSSDTTAPGAHAAVNQTAYTNYFIDPANGDFHLKNTSAALWGLAGTDLSVYFTDDIDGQIRVNWDIGADEYNSTNYDVSVAVSAALSAVASGQAAASGAAAFTTSLGMSDGGGAQASGGYLLPAQVAAAYQAAAGAFAQLALDGLLGVQPAAAAQTNGNLSLAALLTDLSAVAQGAASADLNVSSRLSTSFDGAVSALVIYAELVLSAAMAANAGAGAATSGAVQLPAIVDYGDYGQVSASASMDVAAVALQLTSLGRGEISAALEISSVLAAGVQAQAAGLGGLHVDVVPSILAAATALAQAGFIAAHIVSVFTDGRRIAVTVDTPAWRLVTVAPENRVKVVTPENRIVTVAAENRTISVQ